MSPYTVDIVDRDWPGKGACGDVIELRPLDVNEASSSTAVNEGLCASLDRGIRRLNLYIHARDIGPGLAATTYLMGNRRSQAGRQLHQFGMGGWEGVCMTSVLFVTHIRGSIGVSTSRHAKQL
jgi:hypothetical protein